MKLSKIQRQALQKAPLNLTQGQSDLNRICWTDEHITQDFRRVTIEALISKGLLMYQNEDKYKENVTTVVLTEKAEALGYKSTIQ